ncbi:hypothetical protein FZEAL_5493 [Fusarium zealandicum]|uniref:Alpha/beta hydrolase fold-3 domain-containing protein n=1 Tax=Fusarium zealandicum TaxID=1053134 RepID=A0A8H4XKF4_9HYPO|nr:hypothetical protein FZEAL_5493 [Fusarium zealandicum]
MAQNEPDGQDHSIPLECDAKENPRLTVDERDERHLTTRLVQTILKPIKPALVKAGKTDSADPTRLKAPKSALKRCHIEERQVEGIWVYDLTSKPEHEEEGEPSNRQPRRIIYFGGGGWQMPPSSQHFCLCAELVYRLSNTTVTIVSPPFAPKYPVSEAFPKIEDAYNALLRETALRGESVVVAGDSSGGNIALCLVLWTLLNGVEKDSKPPTAILAISPSTDLRHEHEDIKSSDKFDPILTHDAINSTAETWCPDGSLEDHPPPEMKTEEDKRDGVFDWTFGDPRVSPIQGDLSVLVQNNVKVHGITGSYDVLEPEAVAFREKCKKEGIQGEWLAWEGQMHCFPLAFRYGLKESKAAMDWITDVLERT